MRLGAYPARLRQGSRVAEIYGATEITERHRHRYEVNMAYRDRLEEGGLVFSGMSPDGHLPEIVERPTIPGSSASSSTPSSRAARSSRTRCSPASSRRRWSRRGWCNGRCVKASDEPGRK